MFVGKFTLHFLAFCVVLGSATHAGRVSHMNQGGPKTRGFFVLPSSSKIWRHIRSKMGKDVEHRVSTNRRK